METRELRYFVAVAEELHFGRAAERLGMTQPPLSRTIARLERRLGVALFERTSRSVTLTGPGTVLLAEGRQILGAVAAAERRARQAATGGAGLVLGAKAGGSGDLVRKLLDAYAAEPGAVPVEVRLCEAQPQVLLHRGEADVALLHEPYESTAGLDTEVLRSEGQIVVLPSAHPLAGRAEVRLAEIAATPDPPLARWPNVDGYAEGPGVEVHSLTQLYEMIELGRAASILPESCRADLRDGVVAVPVVDASAVTTVIAWPPHSRSTAVADLIRTASRL
ncbi:LysR family transcriptional regulator [Luteimicrobium xylanilyticum]|uniref:HTH-type transcriptional regulator BsdA n=1 Tax=Luteimicrobium xylanilyticum TaxID=1133546 RepID=A0A5P9QDC6_9MICO|nr:LysR family transcriptional regulator [Luteimicrobium xylanilyticum]QFU98475.1 HTH-type transcriptional regulator BsdA [Luteimicrobium xylanilyticum]